MAFNVNVHMDYDGDANANVEHQILKLPFSKLNKLIAYNGFVCFYFINKSNPSIVKGLR